MSNIPLPSGQTDTPDFLLGIEANHLVRVPVSSGNSLPSGVTPVLADASGALKRPDLTDVPGGGGGGSTTFAGLTDKASADLPSINGPLGTALNAKMANTAAAVQAAVSSGSASEKAGIASTIGALVKQGGWNAATNTPAIPAAAAGNKGHYYEVTTAGTTNIGGTASWAARDWIVSDGSSWSKQASGSELTLAGMQSAFGAGSATEKAAFQSSVSGASWKSRAARSNVGTRVLGARCVPNAAFLGNTVHVMMRLAQEYDAVRLIMCNPCLTATTGVKAAFSPGGSLASPLNSAGVWTGVTWSGASTVSLPATSDAASPTITLSDWIDVTGDASKLLSVRVYIPSAGNTEHPLHSLSMVPATWAGYQNREWIQRSQIGDLVATPASMTATGNDSTTPICGVQYLARGEVITVMGFGDSIMHGTGSAAGPDSWAHRACNALLTSGVPVEWANFGWSSQTTAQYAKRAGVAIPALRPHVVLYPVFSPNDGTPTAAIASAQMSRLARTRDTAASAGALLVSVTGMPRNATASTSAYSGSADDYRKSANAAALKASAVIDVADAVQDANTAGVASRYRMTAIGSTADLSTDFIHPNDAGHDAAAVPAVSTLTGVLWP